MSSPPMPPFRKGPRACSAMKFSSLLARLVSSCTSYLLLHGGWLRGQHWVSDVGLLCAGWLVKPRRSLANGVAGGIRWLNLPGALRHVGRFGAIPAPIPPVVGLLVAALRRRVAVAGLRGPAGRRGIAVVVPAGLRGAVLWGAGRASRCGGIGLAGPEAAVVRGLRSGRLVVRAGLRRPHLDVESRAAGSGGRGVRRRYRLRLQGANGSHRDGCWLPRSLGGGLLRGGEGRLVGDDHPLVAGDWGGHRWGGGGRAAQGPGALGSKERKAAESAAGTAWASGGAREGLSRSYSNICAATRTA